MTKPKIVIVYRDGTISEIYIPKGTRAQQLEFVGGDDNSEKFEEKLEKATEGLNQIDLIKY